MTPGPGIEPETRWREASALTTAPSLLPYFTYKRGVNRLLDLCICFALLS